MIFSVMRFASLRVLLEVLAEALVDHLFDPGLDVRGDELVLGLRGELRVADLDRDDRGETFADVVAFDGELGLVQRRRPHSAYFTTVRVSAALKPTRCVPPSRFLMVLVKQ